MGEPAMPRHTVRAGKQLRRTVRRSLRTGALAAAGIFCLIVAAAAQSPGGGMWVDASDGAVPPGAVLGGQEAPPGSEPLFVCHAYYENSLQPGKVRPGLGACNIPYGGKEVILKQYQVLVGGSYGWTQATGGYIPPNAVQGGNDVPPQTLPLYICNAGYNGGIHPGKIRSGFSGCDIPWGGQEIYVPAYQVLVH